MRCFFISILLFLCVGCAEHRICSYQYMNICFDFQGEDPLSSDQVETLIDIMDDELAVDYSDKPPMSALLEMSNVSVKTYMKAFAINCEALRDDDDIVVGPDVYICERETSGVNRNGELIDMEHRECIYNTALAHELLHTFEHFETGGMTQDHLTPWLFYQYADTYGYAPEKVAEQRIRMALHKQVDCD